MCIHLARYHSKECSKEWSKKIKKNYKSNRLNKQVKFNSSLFNVFITEDIISDIKSPYSFQDRNDISKLNTLRLQEFISHIEGE